MQKMDPIKNRFFGRSRIVREIVEGVLSPRPTSFSIVGTKYVGKSSLLNYLTADDGPLLGDDFAPWRPDAFADPSSLFVTMLDCSWQDVRADLLGYLDQHLCRRLQAENMELDWREIDAQSGAARRIWQMARQLNRLGYRTVVLMDNFGRVFEDQLIRPDSADELRPLATELALVVASQQPLHDMDRELAASPLFNVMTQLFIGLIEEQAARDWLVAYSAQFPAVVELSDVLVAMTGTHPFLLKRIGDILAEVQQYLAPGQTVGAAHSELIRLRLTEHGRLLFTTQWRTLQTPPPRVAAEGVHDFLVRMVATPLPAADVPRHLTPTLNWLINQAVVIYSPTGYRLYSPLFGDFLAARLETPAAPARSVATDTNQHPLYAELTKTEEALLRYFRANSGEVISPEQLLADVWKRPDASPRRVQEAIRRLRLQLTAAQPPVGEIENERGRGYRFVPA